MGNFYTNYTLKGPSQQAVASALKGRTAVVTPDYIGYVTVFDEQSDTQDQEIISDLAIRLSREFSCPVFAVLNHDDDILWFQLYENGELLDEYNSTPGYFENVGPSSPTGGDAKKLCAIFDSSNVSAVEKILRKALLDKDGYAFAVQRHADLVNALGLPEIGVGFAYASFDMPNVEFPDGLMKKDLLRTS